ncbi:MarR family transcriptional regulator [Lewinellaceae bacterium SD302]|nr:MarR family transcriptional regulator [Lewinellaceae bacterium SD302]
MRIEDAIQQPFFQSSMQRAHINILYTAAWLNQLNGSLLKPYGISVQQFNILRILRGCKGKPATIKLLTARMLDKMSNASRLVDKLVSKGLVDRSQCQNDRRRVDITITKSGLELLAKASDDLDKSFRDNFNGLTSEEADKLSNLLDKLRD